MGTHSGVFRLGEKKKENQKAEGISTVYKATLLDCYEKITALMGDGQRGWVTELRLNFGTDRCREGLTFRKYTSASA